MTASISAVSPDQLRTIQETVMASLIATANQNIMVKPLSISRLLESSSEEVPRKKSYKQRAPQQIIRRKRVTYRISDPTGIQSTSRVELCKNYYFNVVIDRKIISDTFIFVILDGCNNNLPQDGRIVTIRAFPDILCCLQSNCGWKMYNREKGFGLCLKAGSSYLRNQPNEGHLEIKMGRLISGHMMIEYNYTIPIVLRTKIRTNLTLI